jgi:hypothetical protein
MGKSYLRRNYFNIQKEKVAKTRGVVNWRRRRISRVGWPAGEAQVWVGGAASEGLGLLAYRLYDVDNGRGDGCGSRLAKRGAVR